MTRLIVNADDFGLSDHTVDWTIKGFERGALTSATIMAGMPATSRAVEYAVKHPQYSFGVHLYLVDEAPVSKPEDIPSMIDPSTGRLWRTRQFILRNFAGLIKVDDLVAEMRAQYSALKNAGVRISHVDGHGHNHRLPQSIKALAILNGEFGFNRVRRCQNVSVGKTGLLGRLINGPMQKRLEKAGMKMTDGFAMNSGHSMDLNWFSKLMRTLSDSAMTTFEIGVHPGVDEAWRKIDIEDCYAYDFHSNPGVELINYNDIN